MFLGPGFGDTDGQVKPALHVQIIRTIWTKQSRGAPGATARARVPLSLPVPPSVVRRGELTVEVHNFYEPNFARPLNSKSERLNLTENFVYKKGVFSLNWNGERALTAWQSSHVGAPTPPFAAEKMGRLEVAPDSCVRLHWQERLSDFDNGNWWYEKTVVNVARCDAEWNADFLGEPARLFEWLPMLR